MVAAVKWLMNFTYVKVSQIHLNLTHSFKNMLSKLQVGEKLNLASDN